MFHGKWGQQYPGSDVTNPLWYGDVQKNHLKKYGEILIKGKNLAFGYSDKNEWNKKVKEAA